MTFVECENDDRETLENGSSALFLYVLDISGVPRPIEIQMAADAGLHLRNGLILFSGSHEDSPCNVSRLKQHRLLRTGQPLG